MNRRSFFALFTGLLAAPALKPPKPSVPSGTILSYAGTQPPPGWVLCNGVVDPGHLHKIVPHQCYIHKI